MLKITFLVFSFQSILAVSHWAAFQCSSVQTKYFRILIACVCFCPIFPLPSFSHLLNLPRADFAAFEGIWRIATEIKSIHDAEGYLHLNIEWQSNLSVRECKAKQSSNWWLTLKYTVESKLCLIVCLVQFFLKCNIYSACFVQIKLWYPGLWYNNQLLILLILFICQLLPESMWEPDCRSC